MNGHENARTCASGSTRVT